MNKEQLQELLLYDPITGVFINLTTRSHNAKAGMVAGAKQLTGHYAVQLNGKKYLLHRLAWLYMTGDWPVYGIDHIDGDPSNNKFENLRDIPQQYNAQNIKRAQKHSKKGILGVSENHHNFMARIKLNGVSTYIGTYKTPGLAHQAYLEFKRIHHPGNTL